MQGLTGIVMRDARRVNDRRCRRSAAAWWALIVLGAALLPGVAAAETLLLIQGYMGAAGNWRSSGISAALVSGGWHDAGTLRADRHGVRSDGRPGTAANRFYTMRLPSEQSLSRQLGVLERYVDYVGRRHPGASLFLVGHSAGGVLARYLMVTNPRAPVAALITIASPHQGVELAGLGARLGSMLGGVLQDSPLDWLGSLLEAGALWPAQALYGELAPERPGNFLYRLNHQPHPRARYISVIREPGPGAPLGDVLVPADSQSMNAVAMLRGRSREVRVIGPHALRSADGALLVRLLRWLQQA